MGKIVFFLLWIPEIKESVNNNNEKKEWDINVRLG